MRETGLVAFTVPLETRPAHRIRVASHETPQTASGWVPEQQVNLVLLMEAAEARIILEAFSNGH